LGEKASESASNSVEFIKRLENPRFLKTHLPFHLLPQEIQSNLKSPKIIYVMRNPKDVCVSFYHHCRFLLRCKTDLENFSKIFLADKVLYGSFWKHVFGFWEKRNLPNMLIITYEDMKEDLSSVIRKVATFMDKTLTNEQVQQLTKHLSFESMKKNDAVNYEKGNELRRKKNLAIEGKFMRSGTVGKYKEELSSETIEKFDAWIKKNVEDTTFSEEYNYYL